jgi:hypothetical protein
MVSKPNMQRHSGLQFGACSTLGYFAKTAKRDIADLKQKGVIEFSGAPKNGYYRLKS